MASGKEQIIRILFPGDFFGQFALLQEKTHYVNAGSSDSFDGDKSEHGKHTIVPFSSTTPFRKPS